MVLAVRVGRPRPFWAGFGLAVVTFGVYSYYWDFKTQDELHKQFELAREGRDQGAVWYVMGFVLPVLRFVYFAHYIGNLRYLRARFGFQRSLTLRAFLGLAVPAAVALILGLLVGLALLGGALGHDAQGSPVVQDPAQAQAGLALFGGGVLLYVVLYAIAYNRLQRDVNEVWAAYDARAAALRAWAAPPPTPPLAAAPAWPGWLPAAPGSAPPPDAAPPAAPSRQPTAGPTWPPAPRP